MAGHVPKGIEVPGGQFASTVEFRGSQLVGEESSTSLSVSGSTNVTGDLEATTLCVAHRDFIVDDLLLQVTLGSSAAGAIQLQKCDPDEGPGEGTNLLDRAIDLSGDLAAGSHFATAAGADCIKDNLYGTRLTTSILDVLKSDFMTRRVMRGQRLDIVLVGESDVTRGLATVVGDMGMDAYGG